MSGSGLDALPDVREWSGSPPKCLKVVGRPSQMSWSGREAFPMSGNGQEALPVVREWSGSPPKCPGVLGGPPRCLGVVGRPSRMSRVDG